MNIINLTYFTTSFSVAKATIQSQMSVCPFIKNTPPPSSIILHHSFFILHSENLSFSACFLYSIFLHLQPRRHWQIFSDHELSTKFGYFLLHACMCNFSNLRNFTNKQDEISKNYNIEIWSKWKLQDSAAISWTKIIAEYCNIHLIKTQIEFFEAPSSFHTTSETDIHCWRQSTKVLESSIVSH